MLSYRVRGGFVLVLGLLTVACGAGRAAAQEGLGNEKALKAAFNNFRLTNLLSGADKYTPADKDVSKTAAELFVYQFTWRDYYRPKPLRTPQQLLRDFHDRMKQAGELAPGNRVFMDVFSRDLIDAVKYAMKSLKVAEQRQQCVNIAQMLSMLALCKNEQVGDFLTEVVADSKQHPLYRFYAVRGLREFFPVYQVTGKDDLTSKIVQDKRARALQRVGAVQAYIFQKWEFTPGVKEELDAVIYQRREGVRTLAQAEVPAVEVEKNALGAAIKVEGAVAVSLMKVLMKDGLTPPASLAERAEAAIGVCKLKVQNQDVYRSDLAVVLVGQLLLDFTEQYVVDYNAAVSTKKIPLLPWRVYAERLTEALKDFQKYSPRENETQRKTVDQIKELVAKVTPLLDSVKALQRVEAPAEFRDFVGTLQLTTTTVFEGVPSTNLKGGKGG